MRDMNTIWKKFNIKILKGYSEIYNKTDIFILTDIFEKFRYECLKT